MSKNGKYHITFEKGFDERFRKACERKFGPYYYGQYTEALTYAASLFIAETIGVTVVTEPGPVIVPVVNPCPKCGAELTNVPVSKGTKVQCPKCDYAKWDVRGRR